MRKNASEENVQWASETLLAKNGLVFCTEDGALNRMQWCEYVVCSGFSHCVKLVVFFLAPQFFLLQIGGDFWRSVGAKQLRSAASVSM